MENKMTHLGKRTRTSQAAQIFSNEPPSTKKFNTATVNVFAHPPVDECNSDITEESSSASCCSSNKLSDAEVESAQVETSTCNSDQIIRRREMGLLSEVVETNSTEQEEEVDSAENKPQKMPTESELDDFFSAAEKHVQKQFQDKYNFDIAKDMPLEGRYEWVQLKP